MPEYPSEAVERPDIGAVRESVGISSERLDRALAILDSWVTQGKTPGVAAVIVRRGRIVARHFRGLAQPGDASRPLTTDTVFPVASVAKTITAVALLTLVESGDVMLDDPVALHVPDFARHGKESVRVRHLLTHTSGLPDMPANNEALRKAHSALSAFVRAAARIDLTFAPGTRVSHSSLGTLMVAEIVERAAKQGFAEYAAERVFRPLGIKETWFRPPESVYPRIAGLRLIEGRKPTNWDNNSAYWRQLGAPWGGLYSTIDDLAVFAGHLVALITGVADSAPVISPASARLMVENHTLGVPSLAGGREGWGFGWALPAGLPHNFAGDLCSPRTFGYRSATGTLLWADPERDLICAVLTNQVTNWGTESRRFGAFSNAVIASIAR